MKRFLIAAAAVAMLLSGLPASAQTSIQAGDLIKMAGNPSVYYFGANGRRYVFPNAQTYSTWYQDFSSVKTVTNDQLSSITIGGNVTYKPGAKMIKIVSDPKVYAVSKDGILRPIGSEAVAAALYGGNWNRMIDDVPDAFFVNYKVGAAIDSAADYDKTALMIGVPNINVDRMLVNPPAGFVDYSQTTGFSPAAITVGSGTKVTWIATDGSSLHVASNPHPTHTDLPGLESSNLGMGQTYSFTYVKTGTWGYHNHNFSGQTGAVTVQ